MDELDELDKSVSCRPSVRNLDQLMTDYLAFNYCVSKEITERSRGSPQIKSEPDGYF